MRLVDNNQLQRPSDWDARAANAKAEVAGVADEDERRAALKARSPVWSELKPFLEELSNKKCWYCEAIQERSDKNVDHFRPKNRVEEDGCVGHPGYWWLAFDWRNFRYSCTYCNSVRKGDDGEKGGKGARFPLRDEAKRCHSETAPILDEQPVLLDPTVAGDPELLWFDEDGRAQPRHGESAPWPHQRASVSITIYHLNHEDIRQARLAICMECKRLVQQADDGWQAYKDGSPVGEERFRQAIERIAERLDARSEYSATARSTLMGLRSEKRPWLDATIAAAA